MSETYIKLSDAVRAVQSYAKARIDAGAECLDLEYDTIELIRILNTVPHGTLDDHDHSGLLEE